MVRCVSRRTLILSALAVPLSPSPALAKSTRPDDELLAAALDRLRRLGDEVPLKDRLAIVDLRQPSWLPRLFLVDRADHAMTALHVAHGRGSDPANSGRVVRLSDAPGSLASTAGAFRVGAPFQSSSNGPALFLDGLEPGNRNARAREIIIHSAPYVTPQWLNQHGKPGRSWGCFVVDPAQIALVRRQLAGGRLLYVVGPEDLRPRG